MILRTMQYLNLVALNLAQPALCPALLKALQGLFPGFPTQEG